MPPRRALVTIAKRGYYEPPRRSRRILIFVSEQERAKGCSTCTLSRCREGSPCCNLTRITLAKREQHIEKRKALNATN